MKLDQGHDPFEKGLELLKKASYRQACEWLDRAVCEHGSGDTYYWRGVAHFMVDDHQKAFDDFSQSIRLMPDFDEAYHHRGVCLLLLDNFNEAVVDFNKAIELNPTNHVFYVNRAAAYERLGKAELADRDREKARELGYIPADELS